MRGDKADMRAEQNRTDQSRLEQIRVNQGRLEQIRTHYITFDHQKSKKSESGQHQQQSETKDLEFHSRSKRFKYAYNDFLLIFGVPRYS